MNDNKPPDVIYLQYFDYEGEGVTWCQDKINDTDVMYIRANDINPDVFPESEE